MEQYIKTLRTEFLLHEDAEKALAMSKYMKGLFPFFGISSPDRKVIQRNWISSFPKDVNRENLIYLILLLWKQKEREFHYVAIDFLNSQSKKFIQSDDIRFIEKLLITNSWWDSIDAIASNYLGKYFSLFPKEAETTVSKWRSSKNMWLNRSCLLYQLKYRNQTNFELLKSLVIQYQTSKEFFIRKAIGWALREYSKHNPEAVRKFIDEIKLEGLAKREASKYL